MTDATPNPAGQAKAEASPEGRVFHFKGESADVEHAIELAFDYRGDVTLTLADGRTIEGYLFDRRRDSAGALLVRVMTTPQATREIVAARDIRQIAFTGRDTAAGKSWETWVRQYAQRLDQKRAEADL